MSTIWVTKHNGEKEPYSEEKIKVSATRVGVPSSLQQDMLRSIRTRLYDGIPTQDIFTIIKSFLGQSSAPYLASKYNLKSALSEIGPTGYPFEQYVARLLTAIGYQTRTNETWRGMCVSHEVDVVATKDGVTYPIEAKFHTSNNQRTDIRVALYIWARYEDLLAGWQGKEKLFPWIITNTRFSTDALSYAKCRNIKVTSWGYPEGEGIMDLIEATNLHPITILETLSDHEKKYLITRGILVCADLLLPENKNFLDSTKRELIISEVQEIISHPRV